MMRSAHAAERQADLEGIVVDRQIPELVLQHDGHGLRILRPHPVRQPHAGRRSVEGDLEMVVARQAVLGGIRQHGAHDAAQGGLGEKVVPDVINRHSGIRSEGESDDR